MPTHNSIGWKVSYWPEPRLGRKISRSKIIALVREKHLPLDPEAQKQAQKQKKLEHEAKKALCLLEKLAKARA